MLKGMTFVQHNATPNLTPVGVHKIGGDSLLVVSRMSNVANSSIGPNTQNPTAADPVGSAKTTDLAGGADSRTLQNANDLHIGSNSDKGTYYSDGAVVMQHVWTCYGTGDGLDILCIICQQHSTKQSTSEVSSKNSPIDIVQSHQSVKLVSKLSNTL